ncbi:MAG: relaxase/mobilization nuclease domain-containing protein [Pseudoflavonifractor sp.]|nr:relaxase/mobilization nuclease domain-containing protein [Pseudoflavonifractor sp.]
MEERFAYGLNPEKLGAVSSYLCDPATAHAEFLLTKSQYQTETGRVVERGALFFQIRQAFPHGEVTPEEANKLGYETAMRWTKGKYQFFVCTHIDKSHIHNHIYYCSTAYDRSRKYHNFIGSAFALRRLSDRVCIEHDLSYIQNPAQHSKGRFLNYGQWLGTDRPLSYQERLRLAIAEALAKSPSNFDDFLRLMEKSGYEVRHGRGGAISFVAPGQERATRLRASTLGDGYDPEDIRAVIAGKRPAPELPTKPPAAQRRVNLIIDIQERMRSGKGPAYERWAKIYNLKQMAAALQFLQEHKLTEYDQLAARTEAAIDRFHKVTGELKSTEAVQSKTAKLMGATVDYAKTRPVFDGYKAARYSRKYLAEHEAELATYRAVRTAMNDILNGAKLPKMDALKEKRRQLTAEKKALYTEYRDAQRAMREAVAVKANIDHLLGLTDERKIKEQER